FVSGLNNTLSFFGMDQIAVNRQGTRIFASDWYAVQVFDAADGAYLSSIYDANIQRPTGISVLGGEIDKVVKTGKPATTEYTFQITYKNPLFGPVVIRDTAPAEWQVLEVAGTPIVHGSSGGFIPDDDGSGLVDVYPGNNKP